MTKSEIQNQKWMDFDKRMTELENRIEGHSNLFNKLQTWMKIQDRTNELVIVALKTLNQ